MIAALLRRPFLTWRSTQLTEAFSWPPRNHCAFGASHSSSFVHGFDHSTPLDISAQNASGSLLARSYSSCLAAAFAAKSAGGGNFRLSVSRASIVPLPGAFWLTTLLLVRPAL